MENLIFYEDSWLNRHLNRVGLINKRESLSNIICCLCRMKLTIEENENNLTYDSKERICNKCNDELISNEIPHI